MSDASPVPEPRWGVSPFGRTRYWTRERVLIGLETYIRNTRGAGVLPFWGPYQAATKGQSAYPPPRRVIGEFGSFPYAWRAAGASRSRQPLHIAGHRWSDEDAEYLQERAGHESLAIIGRRLLRGPDAVKRHLYELGLLARTNTGHLCVSEVAAAYNLPISRVYRFVRSGRLKAKRPRGVMNRWMIEPADVEACVGLHGPKGTHKGTPPQTRPHAGTRGYVTDADGVRRRRILP